MDPPIYVLGRQHSGNTLLLMLLGAADRVHGYRGESTFFDWLEVLVGLPPQRRADRLAEIVARCQQPRLSVEQEAAIRDQLLEEGPENPDRSALTATYEGIKDERAAEQGASRWAQKATTLAFYLEDVRELLPEAKLVFPVRNPFDLATSLIRRGARPMIPRMAIGWNKGVRRALEFEEAHPSQLRVIRYEDLCLRTEDVIAELEDFLDVPLAETTDAVPHVNRSEDRYTLESEVDGIQADRVHYFNEELPSSEARFVQMLIDDPLLRSLYPDLPSRPTGPLPADMVKVAGLGISALGHLAWDQLGSAVSSPSYTLSRIARRLRA